MSKSIDPPRWLFVSNGINALNEYLPKVMLQETGVPETVKIVMGHNGDHFYLYQEQPGEELVATGETLQELLINYGQQEAAKHGSKT